MKKILIALVLLIALSYTLIKNFTTSRENYSTYFDNHLVFVPDNYDHNKNYPLLFMLHGHGADYQQWSDITDLKYLAKNISLSLFVLMDSTIAGMLIAQ